MKPLIRKAGPYYVCSAGNAYGRAVGLGSTPLEAYDDWLLRELAA